MEIFATRGDRERIAGRLFTLYAISIRVVEISYYQPLQTYRARVSGVTYARSYRNKLLSFSARGGHAPRFSAACHPLAVFPD